MGLFNIKTFIRYTTIFILGFSLCGCSIFSAKDKTHALLEQDAPTPDFVNIHKNPKVGDYAIHHSWADKGKTMVIRWEVLSVTDEGIWIERSVSNIPQSISNQFLVSPEGMVKRGYVLFDGVKYEHRIVPRGGVGGWKTITKLDNKPEKPVTTAVGEFTVSDVSVLIAEYKLGRINGVNVFVNFSSEQVPFQIVEQRVKYDIDADAFMNAAMAFSYVGVNIVTKRYSKLLDIHNHTGDMRGISGVRLVEYGFSSNR